MLHCKENVLCYRPKLHIMSQICLVFYVLHKNKAYMCVLESRTFAEMGSLFHKVGEEWKIVPFQILVPCLLFKTNTNFRGKNQKKFTFKTINGDFLKF